MVVMPKGEEIWWIAKRIHPRILYLVLRSHNPNLKDTI
jgi:hypothetical protein